MVPHNTEFIGIDGLPYLISNPDDLQNWERALINPQRYINRIQNPAIYKELQLVFSRTDKLLTYNSLWKLLKGDMKANTILAGLYARFLWIQSLTGLSHPLIRTENSKLRGEYEGQSGLPYAYTAAFYQQLLPIIRKIDPSIP